MSVCVQDWSYEIIEYDIRKQKMQISRLELEKLSKNIFKILDDFDNKEITNEENKTREEELNLLIRRNEELKQQIDNNVNNLQMKQRNYEESKKVNKGLQKEIKDTYEAFLMAKKYYKKFLNIYLTIEEQTEKTQIIFIQFFTESKHDDQNYSLRLLRNITTKRYELINTTPAINIFKKLEKILYKTNDTLEVLWRVREEFIRMKEKTDYIRIQ